MMIRGKRYGAMAVALLGFLAMRAQDAPVMPVLHPAQLFVHSDKNTYFAGETLWLKGYLLDAVTGRPDSVSNIAYVELLDRDNRAVLKASIPLENGFGDGSAFLSPSLNSGRYVLRAYTRWMKNFGAAGFFEKPVTLYNTQKITPQDSVGPAHALLRFYPEGGNLVQSIPSVVAFRASDETGAPLTAAGAIVNERGDTVARFTPGADGRGLFAIKPGAEPYAAVVKLPNGKLLRTPLPGAAATGWVMHAGAEGNALQVSVTANGGYPGPLYLLVTGAGKPPVALRADPVSGVSHFSIPGERLPDGILRLTVFDAGRKPVCERLWFARPAATTALAATSDRDAYGKRKKIAIDLSATGTAGGNYSLSVYRVDSLDSEQEVRIEEYLGARPPVTGDGLEAWLLTTSWRRFDWSKSFGTTAEWPADHRGQWIDARVKDLSGRPVAHSSGFLSVIGTKPVLRQAVDDGDGVLHFFIPALYGSRQFVLKAGQPLDTTLRLELQNDFSAEPAQTALKAFAMNASQADLLRRGSIAMQVHNIYAPAGTDTLTAPREDTVAFYGKPDEIFWFDQYVRFNTMDESLREFVTSSYLIHRGAHYRLPVINPDLKLPFENSALVMIDGVPFFNINRFMTYNPYLVKKLELINHEYVLNDTAYDGILSFTSLTGDLAGAPLDSSMTIVDYEGLQLRREFYQPEYDTPDRAASRRPDFRSVLDWQPELTLDGTGRRTVSFYSSDLPGAYRAVIQGVDANGSPGSAILQFRVTDE